LISAGLPLKINLGSDGEFSENWPSLKKSVELR